MQYYLLVCRSITYAQRAMKVIENAGVSAAVIRLPKNISIDGCGYCVRVPMRSIVTALSAVKQAGLPPVRIFMCNNDGTYKEVYL